MTTTEKPSSKLTEAMVLARTRAPDLENVRKLNCWGCSINDISIVKKLPNLEVCSVSVNKISTLRPFASCTNLLELYIRKNNIADMSELFCLKSLPNLRVLWLADNPCAKREKYRMTVLKMLPGLHKLDNIAVTEEELNTAVEEGEDLTPPASPYPPSSPLAEEQQEEEEGEQEDVDNNRTNGVDSSMTYHGQGDRVQEAVTLSWEETNQIRQQLGLKPLPRDKMSASKSVATGVTRARNANVLQAVLALIKELDRDSLDIVQSVIQNRLESL